MTSPLFGKLNFKDQPTILVLGAPASFESELQTLTNTAVARSCENVDEIDFAIAFATTQEEVDAIGNSLVSKLRGDAIVWFAYPKASSKIYVCGFNRDTGWNGLGLLGLERVRQVSIDEDRWALRFRKPEYIKKMVRTFATTEIGKQKANPTS
jgi:hypothetical protein